MKINKVFFGILLLLTAGFLFSPYGAMASCKEAEEGDEVEAEQTDPALIGDTSVPCKDKIASSTNDYFPSVTGCYVPEYRFTKYRYDPEESLSRVPDDDILRIDEACFGQGNYDFGPGGSKKDAMLTCKRDDYIDDVDAICDKFTGYKNNDVTNNVSGDFVKSIEKDDCFMPRADRNNENWYLDNEDENLESEEVSKNPGIKYKKQVCLELYLSEWAHRGDCGEIKLDSAPTDITVNSCQMVETHEDIRSELWDAFNMYTSGDIDEEEDICVKTVSPTPTGNPPTIKFQQGDGDKLYFGARGCVPHELISQGGSGEIDAEPYDRKYADGNYFPFWRPNPKYLINSPPDSFIDAILGTKYCKDRECGGANKTIPGNIRGKGCDQNLGLWSSGNGPANGSNVYTQAIPDTPMEIPDGSTIKPKDVPIDAGKVLGAIIDAMNLISDEIIHYDFQMPIDSLFGRWWPYNPPRAKDDPLKSTKNLRVERIRDVCHVNSPRNAVFFGKDTPETPVPFPVSSEILPNGEVPEMGGQDIANFFNYKERCSNWIDSKGRTHENIDILNYRLERFDNAFSNAFKVGCPDFQCHCPQDDEDTPHVNEYEVCFDTIIKPNLLKWRNCFWNARDIACPIIARDVSSTITPPEISTPYDGDDYALRWMFEEPNTLAYMPLTVEKKGFGFQWTEAPFMAPNIPFPTPPLSYDGERTVDDGGKAADKYGDVYRAVENSFKGGVSTRAKEGVVGVRGCDIGGWYELMLYQARCMRKFGLNCICDYEKTFRTGSAPTFVHQRSGALLQAMYENNNGVAEIVQIPWYLSWRGDPAPQSAPNKFAPDANPDAKLWELLSSDDGKVEYEQGPFSGRVWSDSKGYSGLDCAQPGDWIIYNQDLKEAGADDLPDESYQAENKERCKDLPDDEKAAKCPDGVPADARSRWHIAYVDAVGFQKYHSGDPFHKTREIIDTRNIKRLLPAVPDPIQPEGWAKAGHTFDDPPEDFEDKFDPANPCKVKKDQNKWIQIQEYNYGKNMDTCGNTDRWGILTERTIYQKDTPMSEDRSCRNPDNAHCKEDNWSRVHVFRPAWDVNRYNPYDPSTLPDGTEPMSGNDFSAQVCKLPERITSENAETELEKIVADRGIYRYGELQKFFQRAIDNKCEPPLAMRGNLKVSSIKSGNLRSSAGLESDQDTSGSGGISSSGGSGSGSGGSGSGGGSGGSSGGGSGGGSGGSSGGSSGGGSGGSSGGSSGSGSGGGSGSSSSTSSSASSSSSSSGGEDKCYPSDDEEDCKKNANVLYYGCMNSEATFGNDTYCRSYSSGGSCAGSWRPSGDCCEENPAYQDVCSFDGCMSCKARATIEWHADIAAGGNDATANIAGLSAYNACAASCSPCEKDGWTNLTSCSNPDTDPPGCQPAQGGCCAAGSFPRIRNPLPQGC